MIPWGHIASGINVLGSASSLFGGSGGKGEAKRSRRALQEAVNVARQQLEFAKQQYAKYEPVLNDFSNFFRENSVEQILSGSVISSRGKSSIRAVNAAFTGARTSLDRSLAQRGIANDAAGQAIRNDLSLSRLTQISDALERSRQQEINDRLQFANIGTQSVLPQVSGAFGSLSGAFANQASGELQNRRLSLDANEQRTSGIGSLAGTLSKAAEGFIKKKKDE